MKKKRKKKRFRSPGEWRRILDRFEQSGLTRTAFCRQAGIACSSFQNWRKKLGAEPASGKPSFIEVLPAETMCSAEIELELPHGIILRIRG